MESIRHYLTTLLYDRKLDCALYIWETYHDSLDLMTKNFLRKLIKSKEILDDIRERFPVNIPSSSSGSEESAEAESDEDVDDETVEYKIQELQKQKKRLTDRIYLLKKRHQYTADIDDIENLFPS